MREIGGYIELDTYRGKMLHDDGIKLNCGRCSFEYIIKAKKIRKIYMPKFMCDSNDNALKNNCVDVKYYSIGQDFKPIINDRDSQEWLYVVNYYGQLSNEYLSTLGKNIIVDNAQAYFQESIEGIDTLYTCRKFFGVTDGAILYTDAVINNLERDVSYDRMNYILGRYEKTASEFYNEYTKNNDLFENENIKTMSRLTENLLHGIDYEYVKRRRTENFRILHNKFKKINLLDLIEPEGAFMYPLYLRDGYEIRKKLQKRNIYIPMLWPNVLINCREYELEFNMARNILPLPIDQRYSLDDMRYLTKNIEEILGEK